MPLPSNTAHDEYSLSYADEAPRELLLTFAFVFPLHALTKAESGSSSESCSPAFLKTSLFRAISEKLPRAGGRLARKSKHVHVLQVPHTFTETLPPAGFSVSLQPSTPAPSLYNLSSVNSGKPAVISPSASSSEDLVSHFRGPSVPSSLSDLLNPSTCIPVTHAHVSVWSDKVFVGLTLAHAVFDAHAAGMLVGAWAAATRGELNGVPKAPGGYAPLAAMGRGTTVAASEFKGAEDDSEDVGFGLPRKSTATAASTSEGDKLSGNLPSDRPLVYFAPFPFAKAVSFIIRFAWKLIRDPEEERIVFRIPKEWARAEKERMVQELAGPGTGIPLRQDSADSGATRGDDSAGLWLSTNDVLSAHIFRWVNMHRLAETSSATKRITLHTALNLRLIAPKDFATHPSVSNCIFSTGTQELPVSALEDTTSIARAVRESVNLVKEDQVKLLEAVRANASLEPGSIVYPCAPGQTYALLSSWTSARLAGHPFQLHESASKPTRPDWVVAYLQEKPGTPMRNTGAVFSDDGDAFWVGWWVGKKEWTRLEKALRERGEVQFAD